MAVSSSRSLQNVNRAANVNVKVELRILQRSGYRNLGGKMIYLRSSLHRFLDLRSISDVASSDLQPITAGRMLL